MDTIKKKFLGQKLEMTQIFKEDRVIPVTKVRIINQQGVENLEGLDIGKKVNVQGISKGKGFQGVVKRFGFHGSPATHGTKHTHRAPGSIGATGPQRVFKGKKMPGRMGGNRRTIKNLEIVKIDKDIIFLKGAVPGYFKSSLILSL